MSSFNRYSTSKAKLTRQMDETQRIVGAIAETFDAKKSDDLTTIAAEAIKSLVFHMVAGADPDGVTAKDMMQMASALRQAAQGQQISAVRRAQVEKDFAEQAEKAIDAAAKAGGLTKQTVDKIKADILGVAA